MAAYFTLLNNLYPEQNEPQYSYTPAHVIEYKSETDFGRTINGKSVEEVWRIMDELMTVIQVLKPKLYDGVMRKLNEI